MSDENNINKEVEETSEEQVRTPRGSEDREIIQRPESWENPSNIPRS